MLTHLGDMPISTFLAEYWQKKPVVIRNAFANFAPPIDANDLAGLACEKDVESRIIRGSETSPDYQLEHGPFSEDDFAQDDVPWTLLVQGVDHWAPEASLFLEQFNFVPNWRVDDLMISYATQGGGVGPHFDHYDVFLIQAFGQRRWEVGPKYTEQSPIRPNLPVKILEDWQTEESYDLGPGDLLYIPPQFGHNGTALDDECVTYSVGFRAPSHKELFDEFSAFLSEKLCEEDRYADPDLTPQDSPAEITEQSMASVKGIFEQYLNDPNTFDRWFGQQMTQPKYEDIDNSPEEDLGPLDIQLYIGEGDTLNRNEGTRIAYREAGEHFFLFVDGHTFECSTPELKELALALCNERVFASETTLEQAELLATLYNQGSLYFEEGAN